jgi:hypothetical protein
MTLAQVWQQLTAVFPEILIEYGPVPTEHWQRMLESLRPDELNRALQKLQTDPPAQRPNALEFVELGRERRPLRYRGPLRTDADRHADFACKRSTPATVDAYLAKIRSRLQEPPV